MPDRLTRFGAIGCLSLAAALLLAGCNVVTGPSGSFGDGADRSQTLKPGFWKTACRPPDDGPRNCLTMTGDFMVSGLTAMRWPPLPVSHEDLGTTNDQDAASMSADYAIVPGDPTLMEWKAPEGFDDGAFFFTTIAPVARDGNGRITRLKVWPVLCGPPKNGGVPTFKTTDNDEEWVTERPLPGLKMKGDFCSARDMTAVRDAARTARNSMPVEFYWAADRAP